MPRAIRVPCIDGGLADLGWVLAGVGDDATVHLLAAGTVHTKPTATTKVPGASLLMGTSISADTARRSLLIGQAVDLALHCYDDPRLGDRFALAHEAFSPPRGAASAGLKVGFGLGAALTAGTLHAARTARVQTLAQATPTEVKRLFGVPAKLTEADSKARVRAGVQAALPRLEAMLEDTPRGQREHAYDAAGVLLACIDRDRFAPMFPMRT